MGALGNVRLSIKLGVAFAVVVAIFGFVAWRQIEAMYSLEDLQESYAMRASDLQETNTIDSRLESLYSIVADAVINRNVRKAREEFDAFAKQARSEMAYVSAMADTGEESKLADKFAANYEGYLDLIGNKLLPYIEDGGSDMLVIRSLDSQIDSQRNLTMQVLDKFMASIEKEAFEAQERFENVIHAAEREAMILSIVGAILAAILATLVTIGITRPLKRTADFALSVAEGNIDKDLDIRQMDEVGNVAWAMRRISEALRNVTTEFDAMSSKVIRGHLRQRADTSTFKGAYARLMGQANRLADDMVGYMDDMPLPLMTIDKDFNILFMNKAGASLGDLSPEEIRGRKCYDHFRTGDCQTPGCACDKAIQSGGHAKGETDAHPGGQDLEISYHATPITDENGRSVGAFEIVLDQTQIVRAKKKMEQLAERSAEIANRLSSAAEELSAQVEQSSRGADVQRERASETATAMEQMNATVMEVAENASSAASFADQTQEKAKQGSEVVERVVGAFRDVRAQTDSLSANMAELGEQTESIGRIMNVITDIADQTNLLALNAAIEAARAGEAGRGFAVVADEVRKLAEKTMAATKEVGDAVTAIQDGTRRTIEETERASTTVAESAEQADASGKALREILEMAESTADQVRAIATASEEQSAASEEISRATDEINRISSETSEAMIQSSQAISELARLAGELQEVIDEMNA